MRQAITLHNTNTEEIIGMVTPLNETPFNLFFDCVYDTWVNFNNSEFITDDVDDFVEFHNNNSELKIDSLVTEFIQL